VQGNWTSLLDRHFKDVLPIQIQRFVILTIERHLRLQIAKLYHLEDIKRLSYTDFPFHRHELSHQRRQSVILVPNSPRWESQTFTTCIVYPSGKKRRTIESADQVAIAQFLGEWAPKLSYCLYNGTPLDGIGEMEWIPSVAHAVA
jgi:hypothetical protein